jgi:outer membrane protein TolC
MDNSSDDVAACRAGAILCVLVALGLAGCARFEPRPLSAERSAVALESRRLESQDLELFLKQNMQREFPEWPPKNWDLEMLTFAGFYYHPSLALARAQWQVAKGGEVTAGQQPNPTLTVSPSYNTTTAMASPWLLVTSLDVPIETAGKRGKRQAQAARLSGAARLNIASVAWQVRSGIRSSLLNEIAAGAREAALTNQVLLQESVVQRQQEQFEAGAIARSDTLAFRLALEKARLDLADAQRTRAEARAKLAEAIGVPIRALDGIQFNFDLNRGPESVKELASAEIRRTALTSRADILQGLAEYAATQAALELEIAKQYPDVHLQPGYEFDQGDNKWGIGASVELPVFSRNQGPIAEAKAKREESAARFVALQARVLAEIDRSLEVFNINERNYSASRNLADIQAKRAQAISQQVESGELEPVELLNAQVETAVAQTAQLDNQIKLQLAIGALEDAIQRPLLPEVIFKTEEKEVKATGQRGEDQKLKTRTANNLKQPKP